MRTFNRLNKPATGPASPRAVLAARAETTPSSARAGSKIGDVKEQSGRQVQSPNPRVRDISLIRAPQNQTKPDQTGPENENFHSGPRPETRNRKIRANRQDAECAKSESGKRKVETEMNCLVVKENYQLPSCNFQLPTAITTPHHAFFGLEGSRPQLAKVTRDYQRLPAMTEN